MNIKLAIYEVLTPRQRIISMIDALGREDQDEIKRLRETCKRKNYSQRDAKYSDVLERLFEVSMAVESDLRGVVIGFLESDNAESQDVYIQEVSNFNAAWFELLETMGINKDSMLKAASTRHYGITALLEDAPPPDEKRKNEILKEMTNFIAG